MTKRSVLHLHHVGYAAKMIEPLVQQYVLRFGYEICTDVIHDPLETALVQFLRLPGDQAYLEFFAPDGPDSKLISAARRGGNLNHLCYTAGRLEEAIAELEENGMRLISEPKMAMAFARRRICWLIGDDALRIELVERRDDDDLCPPGLSNESYGNELGSPANTGGLR
jgi:methylmalonyl-CoA/ethylmalonyl-CoA epimerase